MPVQCKLEKLTRQYANLTTAQANWIALNLAEDLKSEQWMNL
jgi:hypothetical protein